MPKFKIGQKVYLYNRNTKQLQQLTIISIMHSEIVDCKLESGNEIFINKNTLALCPEDAREMVIKDICSKSKEIKNKIEELLKEDRKLNKELGYYQELKLP